MDQTEFNLVQRVAEIRSRSGSRLGKSSAIQDPSKYTKRDNFFAANFLACPFKGDQASMEIPVFSLSTKPDIEGWSWQSKDGKRFIRVVPSVLGCATQHDKDILIYITSQLVEALNRGNQDIGSLTVRFIARDLLKATNRDVSGNGYKRFLDALDRLRSTTINTDIMTGNRRIRKGFGLIDSWQIVEKTGDDTSMAAIEVTISKWLFNAIMSFEVLTIHPDYFKLRKPLERKLYELARKHCGKQNSWSVQLDLLKEKSGSKATLKEFRRSLRQIITADKTPEYNIRLEQGDKVVFVAR